MTLFFSLILTIFCVDILSKKIIIGFLLEPVSLLGEFVQLKLVFNKGVAFSLPITGWLSIIISVVLIFFLLSYYYKNYHLKSKFYTISFALIIGWALGNLYERIFFGQVTDFIKIWIWPIFNLADFFICLGVGLFFYWEFFKKP